MQYSRFPGEMSRGNKVKIRVSRVQGTHALSYTYVYIMHIVYSKSRAVVDYRKAKTNSVITRNETRNV